MPRPKARQQLGEFLHAQRLVLFRDGGRRGFQHPRRGRVEYDQFTLRVAQRPDLKLTVLAPTVAKLDHGS
jgi:hypothetical protein